MKTSLNYITSATALLIILSSAACSNGHDSADAEHESDHHEESSVTTVHIEPTDMSRLGIELAEVVPDTFMSAVKASGEILPSTTGQSLVTAPTSGIIRYTTNLQPGSKLANGQRIAQIDASEISGAVTDRLSTAALQSAHREYDRINKLFQEGLATRAELNAALSAVEAATAQHSPRAASGSVVSGISGIVTSVEAVNGQYVEAGQTVATVTGSGKMTLRVDIPERYASILKRLSAINISPAGSNETFTVGSSSLTKSPESGFIDSRGYMPLAVSFDNPGITYTGVFADIYLLSDAQPNIISVPRESLIEDQGAYFVYVSTDEDNDHFERRLVETGEFDGRRIRIKSGLKPGETIVVKGAPMMRMAQGMSTPAEGHHHH